jgi:tetrahydromethanopterin S-methyltransferase subunit D
MTTRIACLALVAAMLAGCAGGGGGAPVRPAATSPPPRGAGVAAPQVMAAAGLEGVIGSSAAALVRRFGEPRINLAEGDARKLQYVGSACVLDIYLYPVGQGAEPTATHVEARIRQGGAATDAGACIRQIERR